jgi:ribosomally synthesized peptide (two-chain TOMM family)
MSSSQQRTEEEVEAFTRAVTSRQEDPVQGLDTQLKWQYVWVEAIALAWRDPAFKARLLKDPRNTLLEYFNFDLGPYVELTVREATPPDPSAASQTGLQRAFGGWDPANDPLKSGMIMVLPPAPKVEDQAVALSFYNASGRSYPFTTCC